MSNEQLVNLITKEVLKRLNAMLQEKSADDQKKVLILEKKENEKEEIEKEEKKNCSIEKNYDCNFVDLTNKRLICETDLKNLMKYDILKVIVSKTAIVTPLAMDFIRTNKLQLDKK